MTNIIDLGGMQSGTPEKASTRKTMNGKPVFTVPNKTIINFDSGFAPKLLCDGMTFTAGTACVYDCSFCSVSTTMRKHMPWMRKHGVVGEHADVVVRRENAVEIARKQILSKPKAFRDKKQVIYASPLVDVAGNMDLVRETVEICKVILELTNWDIRLLSKSNLLPKVAEMLGNYGGISGCVKNAKERVIYGVSTGTLDDKLAAAFEQGTAKVSARLKSLWWLQDNGFRTFGMICPSLPQSNYMYWAHRMAEEIRAYRCEHIWAEVINVRGESFARTHKSLYDAGFFQEAEMLRSVSENKENCEIYARITFTSPAAVENNRGKLRFLQYVTKETAPWWEAQKQNGAVLL